MWMRAAFGLIGAPLLIAPAIPCASATEMFDKSYRPCGDQPSTPAIVECVQRKTQVWDAELNATYQALQKALDPGQREPLKRAQRAWLQFRDENCGYYGSGDGTIHRVQAAECMRVMTANRAQELEEAARM